MAGKQATCATQWTDDAGCLARAVCSTRRSGSAMFFRICPTTVAHGGVQHLWTLFVSSCDRREPHQDLFKTVKSAKRAAADYVRGFRR